MLKFERSQYRKKERVANRLDPDQARHVAGPDLGPNVCQIYQQTTPVGKELKRSLIYRVYPKCYF